MGFVKCPRCELNYMQETEDYCEVCKREMRTKFVRDDDSDAVELCIECNERPALPGEELCAVCKLENMASDADDEEDIVEETIPLDDVSEMDEIELDVEDMPSEMEEEMDEEDESDEAEDDDE